MCSIVPKFLKTKSLQLSGRICKLILGNGKILIPDKGKLNRIETSSGLIFRKTFPTLKASSVIENVSIISSNVVCEFVKAVMDKIYLKKTSINFSKGVCFE